MTSLNSGVIAIRLIIGVFIQRELTSLLPSGGYAKVGSLRNLMQMLMSITSFGIFNGIVKYVAEHKEDKEQLQKLFSTAFVFTLLASIAAFFVLFFFAKPISSYFFFSEKYDYVIKIVAVITPFIAIQRVFNGVVNGLSKYKSFSTIEITAYLISAGLTLFGLYKYNLNGVLIAIAIIPVVQVLVMLVIFIKVLREYVQFSQLRFATPLAKSLLAFSLMSFVSSILLNFLEVDIRGMIEKKLGASGADEWTAMTTLSKNYMVFSSALFSLYVLPMYSKIFTKIDFIKEVRKIFKTLLPLFAIGMIVIYFSRQLFIDYIYVNYQGMNPLFKWQLAGDFIRLIALILAHQFFAKKLVRNFIFTEILSLALFYFFANYLSGIYGVEGVVMAHFFRYVIYLIVVAFLVNRYFLKVDLRREI